MKKTEPDDKYLRLARETIDQGDHNEAMLWRGFSRHYMEGAEPPHVPYEQRVFDLAERFQKEADKRYG